MEEVVLAGQQTYCRPASGKREVETEGRFKWNGTREGWQRRSWGQAINTCTMIMLYMLLQCIYIYIILNIYIYVHIILSHSIVTNDVT
jgi:hypothetical protein